MWDWSHSHKILFFIIDTFCCVVWLILFIFQRTLRKQLWPNAISLLCQPVFCSAWPWTLIAKDNLQFLVLLLPPPSGRWDYKCVLWHWIMCCCDQTQGGLPACQASILSSEIHSQSVGLLRRDGVSWQMGRSATSRAVSGLRWREPSLSFVAVVLCVYLAYGI